MPTLAQVFAAAEHHDMTGGGPAVMETAAPFGWPGGKKILKHRIIALIPSHKTYVEPFAGAASVFWAKEPSQVEVLNDADPDLMRFYQNIGQAAQCDTAQVSKDWESLKARQGELSPCEFFSAVQCSFGQGGFKRGMAFDSTKCTNGQPHFHKALPEYQVRLAQTKLHNEDFEPVVRRYDSSDTFFYLDPPYHGTSRRYAGGDKDVLGRLAKVLPTLKGKWLLSYDNHPEVRAAFQGSHIRKVQTHYTIAAGDNNHVAKELLIANYPIGRHGMEQDHPNMDKLGPPAWAELHAWAARFAAKVGDSCGCGRFARDATRALHDLVSVKLGKQAMYPEILLEVAKMYQEAADSLTAELHQDSAGRIIWKQISIGVKMSMGARDPVVSEDSVHFTVSIKRGQFHKIVIKLNPADEYDIRLVRITKDLSVVTEAERHSVQVEELNRVLLSLMQQARSTAIQSNIEPWPEGMFEEEEEEEEEEDMFEGKAGPSHARLSQSFIDTILHTAVGAATALAVTKALTPPSADIKEGDKPQGAPALPPVLSPAHVEGDQADVDLGTLLEEIDAILKKPETMGVVDADTLTIVRA